MLRDLLARGPAEPTRSEAEERVLAPIGRARLTAPQVHVVVHGHEVDFFWREEGLVVEVDGFAFHRSRASFELDRRRDSELASHGLRVIRLTWRRVVEEPEATLVLVARTLALAGPVRPWGR